jgi:VWFA-related protein
VPHIPASSRSASLCATFPLLLLTIATANAQQTEPAQPAITAGTTVVLVPALVKTNKGDVIFNLAASDFSLTDNGIPQHLTLDPDTDSQPLALAICVQTGGAAARHLPDYEHLSPMLDALIGGVERRIAVIGFDSAPHLVLPFSPSVDEVSNKLATLDTGNRGAAILDAVAFAVAQLKTQPAPFRRAILLLSETIDQGSETSLGEALRLIGDSNTTLYSFGFPSTRAALSHEADKFGYGHPTEPGPEHGCFSRDGADAEYEGHYSHQVLDCLSQLAPPLRLATMAFLTARNGLRTNTSASLAQLTGGEFFRFNNAKQLREGLIAASHDVHNYYFLSFRPSAVTPGPHALHLEIATRSQLTLKSRSHYWIDDSTR